MNLEQHIDLSVIIVNYNTLDLLINCLQSVFDQQGVGFEVIVVDNASKENPKQQVLNLFPQVKYVSNSQNVGFAKANNQAISLCQGQYIFYLNPDTVVLKNSLSDSVAYMNTHQKIGLAGCRLINPDYTLQSSVEMRYPGQRFAKKELSGLAGDIAWVLGAAIIVRKPIVDQIGGFDERFFLYGEDLDMCLNVRKQGWQIGYIHDTQIIHYGGQSEKDNLPEHVFEKKFKAELTFFNKHYSQTTVRKIKRSNRIQACWRIMTLSLTGRFSRNKSQSFSKLRRYKKAWEIYK